MHYGQAYSLEMPPTRRCEPRGLCYHIYCRLRSLLHMLWLLASRCCGRRRVADSGGDRTRVVREPPSSTMTTITTIASGGSLSGSGAPMASGCVTPFRFPSTAFFGLASDKLNRWSSILKEDDADEFVRLLEDNRHQLTLVYDHPSCNYISFHRLTHLCAFNSAINCMRQLVSRYETPIWCAKDTNESTVFHALCWGAHYQKRQETDYISLYRAVCALIKTERLRELLLSEDLGGFRPVELAIKLRCFRLAVEILETPGVYQESSLRGNLQVKRYYLHGYFRCGTGVCRSLRNPVLLLSELRKADFKELRSSNIMNHPVVKYLITQLWYRNVVICVLLALFWLALIVIMQIPLEMQMQQVTTDNETCFSREAIQVAFYTIVVHDLKVLENVSVRAIENRTGVNQWINRTSWMENGNGSSSLMKADRIGKALLVSRDQSSPHVQEVCGLFSAIRYTYGAVSVFLFLWHAVTICQRLWIKLRMRRHGQLVYKRFLNSVETGWMDQDWLSYLCRVCLILFSIILFTVRISSLPCPQSPLYNYLIYYRSMLNRDNITNIFLILRVVFHLCYLFLHILLVYYLEMIPHLGPVVHAFRCMFSRFLSFAAIYLVVLWVFSSIFFSVSFASVQTHQDQEKLETLKPYYTQQLRQVYYAFTVSLNMEKPSELVTKRDQIGNSEASVVHLIFVLVFAVLVLNFIIALLVSAMNEVNEFRDIFYRIRTTRMFLQIDAVWYPVLARISDITGWNLTGQETYTTVTPV